MIYLVEISVPLSVVLNTAINIDPLVSSDIDYCVKTWMAVNLGLACRPWRKTTFNQHLRVTGWRRSAPGAQPEGVYVGLRQFSVQAGERLTLSGHFVALRRNRQTAHDAAAGWTQPSLAYEGWLTERLIDLAPYATVTDVKIERYLTKSVLRKVDHRREWTKVQLQTIPEVFASVTVIVIDPLGVEAWLLKGLGPQKAFGYGAFIPTINLRE